MSSNVMPIQPGIGSIVRGGGPKAVRTRQAQADALIDFAAKVQDWAILEEAIDLKIEDQVEFVGWWDENVGSRRGLNRHTLDIADRAMSTKEDAASQTGITFQQVSRWRKHLADKPKYRERMILAAYRKADLVPPENHLAQGTGDNEWFTPGKYIEAARSVMGGIDLDPATHPAAQQTVQATEFFTRQDDGLTKEWHGSVWLNLPCAQPMIGQFVEKLVGEFASGRVSEAIMVTHNYTDAAWFHMAAASASLICFTKGRIRFVDVDGEECSPTQGQALFYFGTKEEEFCAAFGAFGFVVRTVNPSAHNG